MFVICRHYSEMDACSAALTRKRVPHLVRNSSSQFNPLDDTIKVMTMHASKGLEFPVVAVSEQGLGVGNAAAMAQTDINIEARRDAV